MIEIEKETLNKISNIEPQQNSDRFRLSALNWFNLGLNVLPTKDKKPLVKWEEWQSRRESMHDIESMPWRNANGYAVVCGLETTLNFNGVQKKAFLGVIDIDDKDTFDFSVFPETFIEKTPHGFHLFYWNECPVDAIKYQGFELLGSGNICCIYDSPDNKSPIALHSDIQAQFEYTCKQLGVSTSKKTAGHTQNAKTTTDELLKKDVSEGHRDNTAIRLASKLRFNKKTQDQTLVLLLEWNQKHCKPPLDENIIEQKVESAYKPNKPYFDKGNTEKFDRIELRDELFHELIIQYHFATLPNEEMYVYGEGVYLKQGVKSIVKSATAKRFDKHYLKEDCEQILDRIKAETFKDKDFFSTSNIPLNLICLENGIIDLNNKELKPHSPTIPFLNKLPVKFDPNAKCPLIDEKMHEWLESEEHVQAMYELIGYCLWREYTYQNAFFFVGEGSNGKTTLIKLITAFLGSENVSNIPIQDLGDEFKTVNLLGKLANIADELSAKALEDTSKFKQLTGDSPMSGYKKYVQEAFQFVSIAKQLFATNELPKTSDNSQAFFRRPIIFEFNKTFNNENGKKDPDLIKKLTESEELSGLLNKAIEGLNRLNEKKAFTIQPSSTDTEELWTKDTIQEFASEYLESGSKEDVLPFEQVYFKYLDFLKTKNACDGKTAIEPMDKSAFGLKLKNCIKFVSKRMPFNGSRQYCYIGIRFKDSENKSGRLL
jgi:putative DNA primase/helicase